MTARVTDSEDQACAVSHYAVIVDLDGRAHLYQLGDAHCASCLRRMAQKHVEVAAMFRDRLAQLIVVGPAAKRCRCYDALCINPTFCDARDACCAGDPACRAEVP